MWSSFEIGPHHFVYVHRPIFTLNSFSGFRVFCHTPKQFFTLKNTVQSSRSMRRLISPLPPHQKHPFATLFSLTIFFSGLLGCFLLSGLKTSLVNSTSSPNWLLADPSLHSTAPKIAQSSTSSQPVPTLSSRPGPS